MAVDTTGLIIVLVFYALILTVGIVAAFIVKRRNPSTGDDGAEFTDNSMVAGRDMGMFVGIITLSATSVGGGFLSGAAEGAAIFGLLWTVFPLGICVGLSIGGFVFAKPMRERKYVTMLDPLQERYGDVMTAFLLVATLASEIMWGATVLLSLGTNLSVIIGLNVNVAIIISSGVAVVYTVFGQMVSVAYTDVLQFGFVIVGMILCIPFILTNDKVGNIGSTSEAWLGSIGEKFAPSWCDFFIAQTLGSIPWNTYFMRVLSSRNVSIARGMSVAAGVISLVMAVPPFLIGAVSTVAALAAIAAAVMSSIDSIILSSSSMFTRNMYQMAFRPKAKQCELMIAQAVSMTVVTASCLLLAIYVDSIYGVFILAADILYITVFPQLVCAVFMDFVNPYGSLVGYIVGVVLRFGCGESTLGIGVFIKYPQYSEDDGQLFPFRTFAMLCSILCIVVVSKITNVFIRSGKLPPSFDVFTKNVQKKNTKGEQFINDDDNDHFSLTNGHTNPSPF